jgi:outer membrane protein insertion porin family
MLNIATNGATVTTFSSITSTFIDNDDLRLSSGFGVSYKSPLGPISVDFAVPILFEQFDQRQVIRVNFGTKF